jgi:hypothetical protein
MNMIGAWGDDRDRCILAEQVVNFCVKKLMPRMRTLDICVEVTDDCDVCGYCMAVDKREFVIEIKNDLPIEEFISTLCHEMVHVAQYATGRLAINGKQTYKTYEEYLELWYEKEAYEQEGALAKEFMGA